MFSIKISIAIFTILALSSAFQITKVPFNVDDDGIHPYNGPINLKVKGCSI